MSRIRNVKGKIIKITRGDHYICSETNINNNAATSVVQTSEEGIVFGDYKEIIFPPDKSLIRCAVHFRPHKAWKGEEYGFDWMRMGDGEGNELEKVKRGDIPYRYYLTAALGVSSTERDVLYRKLKDAYESPRRYFQWTVKDLKGNEIIENGKPLLDEYCPSWLMLFPKQINDKDSGYENTEATLSIIVDNQTEAIKKYRLEYDKDLFEISHSELPTTKGLYKDLSFKVKCLKPFDKPQEIRIIGLEEGDNMPENIPHRNIVGKLKVLDNATIYQPKIVLVRVITDFEVKGRLRTGRPETEEAEEIAKAEIKKYLKQSLMIPKEIIWDKLDITTTDKEEKYYAPGSSQPMTFKRRDKFLEHIGMVNGKPRMMHGSHELQTDLLQAFMHDTGTRYTDYFKVFYMDEATMADAGLGVAQGIANTSENGKSCIVFREGLNDKDTAIHELLHAMGLRHSFDYNLFIFKEKTTDNIMDYNGRIITATGEKERDGPEKIHLWKWQIDILRDNAKNDYFKLKP